MPLHFCHPNTPHRKLRMPEWFVSSLMMDRALDAVVRRAKTLDRKHDIPYLAGYSKDGKTIYIDRHMPSSFRYDGRDINTDRYLILHEEVEKTLIDQLKLRVDTWTSDGESIVEHVAGVEDYQVALATYRAACERWPASGPTPEC